MDTGFLFETRTTFWNEIEVVVSQHCEPFTLKWFILGSVDVTSIK